ncbi:MAG: hypothetical protein IKU28_08185 [Erysipelotrichaceae bacterium]|nr:hypothetical protein [Erysipelotrichaceae bacterium]
MLQRLKHHFLKGFKIALGTVLGIVIAELLHLQFATSAGTVALLTLLTTKRGTVRLIVQRLVSFVLTVVLCFVVFKYITIPVFALLIVVLIVAFLLVVFKCEAALSVNALIAIHFFTEQNFTPTFILNEFLLVLIGIVIAFVLNLFHRYTAYENELDAAINKVDKKIQSLMKDIVSYICHPDSHSASWGQLVKLEQSIQQYIKDALEYDENVFGTYSQYYVDYFEMRSFQCETLHLLHYKIRKIRTMPEEAKELADFIEYLIPHLRETNDPSAQLLVLRDLLEAQKKHALPQSHEEFENRAILYHVLLDLEDFLLRKKQFVDRLDDEQKILHWQNKG